MLNFCKPCTFVCRYMLLSNLLRAKTSKFQMPAASQLGSWPVLPSVPVLDSTRNYGVVRSSKFLQPDPQPAPPDFPMPVSTWSGRIVSRPAYPKDFEGVKVQKYFPFIEEISTQDGVVFKGKMSSSSLVMTYTVCSTVWFQACAWLVEVRQT